MNQQPRFSSKLYMCALACMYLHTEICTQYFSFFFLKVEHYWGRYLMPTSDLHMCSHTHSWKERERREEGWRPGEDKFPPYILCSIIHGTEKVETAQVFTPRWTVVSVFLGLLLSCEKAEYQCLLSPGWALKACYAQGHRSSVSIFISFYFNFLSFLF